MRPNLRAFSSVPRLFQVAQNSSAPVQAQTILPTDENQNDIEFDVTDSPSSKQKSKKVKNEKVVLWKMYGTFNRHNTHISLVAVVEDLNFLQNNPDLSYNEQVLYYLRLPHQQKVHVSAGQLGFRKAQRQEYEAGYQVTTRAFKLIQDKKLLSPTDKIELVLKNFGKGREAFLAALLGKEGNDIRPHIVRVSDNTILKFGGTRSKKLRRL